MAEDGESDQPKLFLDSCGPDLILALHTTRGKKNLIHTEHLGVGHAERMIPALEALFQSASVKSSAPLALIAVTTGPGSFTGLRVGFSAARALALATQTPLLGLNRLQLTAASHQLGSAVAVTLDARRGEHYVQAFDEGLQPLTGPQTIANASISTWVKRQEQDHNESLQIVSRLACMDDYVAAAFNLAANANALTHKDLKPLYVRPPDAKPQKKPPFLLA